LYGRDAFYALRTLRVRHCAQKTRIHRHFARDETGAYFLHCVHGGQRYHVGINGGARAFCSRGGQATKNIIAASSIFICRLPQTISCFLPPLPLIVISMLRRLRTRCWALLRQDAVLRATCCAGGRSISRGAPPAISPARLCARLAHISAATQRNASSHSRLRCGIKHRRRAALFISASRRGIAVKARRYRGKSVATRQRGAWRWLTRGCASTTGGAFAGIRERCWRRGGAQHQWRCRPCAALSRGHLRAAHSRQANGGRHRWAAA